MQMLYELSLLGTVSVSVPRTKRMNQKYCKLIISFQITSVSIENLYIYNL